MVRIGLVSTYPPTRCGIANFSASLGDALAALPGTEVAVVRLLDAATDAAGAAGAPVVADLPAGDPLARERAAAVLNRCDVAVVQHEYGIYGGEDGAEVLDLLERMRVPAVVVLHTVLDEPSPGQRSVLERLCAAAAVVVVMTAAARAKLAERYRVDLGRVQVIPHGVLGLAPAGAAHEGHRVLTWGLIGPGKGIEWGVRAIAELAADAPPVSYVVFGQTHPKVLAHEGDRYRESLQALVAELGLEHRVTLVNRYLSTAEVGAELAAADVVLLPYDSTQQITSGVLVEAVAAGVPVVATDFPHSRELLDGENGRVVAHRDPKAIADAVRGLRGRVRRAPSGTSPWADVARAYRALADRLAADVAA